MLVDPLPVPLAARLRRLVLDHRVAQPRRVYAPVLHLGVPGLEVDHGIRGDVTWDHGLRSDVVAALLRRSRGADPEPPLVWLSRPGDLALHDVDVAWLSAARTAFAEAGVPLTMVVLTRQGWRDPRSGAGRVWKRLRQR